MRELALFAGAGGGLLASGLLGWSTVCAVELEPYARKVLLQRQRDGHLERFPIWNDVCTFDGNPWRGAVDVISGGFPCQDISSAGKGKGIAGERSSLIWEMLRIAEEVQPRFIFAENSSRLRTYGLGAIVATLERMGYDCAWCVLGARHVGAPHRRDRLWLLAHANGKGKPRQPVNAKVASKPQPYERPTAVPDANGSKERRRNKPERQSQASMPELARLGHPIRWQVEPSVGRMVNGMAGRMDQLKAIGNGQVPQVAALAFKVLSETLGVSG